MLLFDEKAKGIINAGNSLIIPEIFSDDDITFKASFIIATNIQCSGKITALFDLIVMGDINAEELDVKGRFICLGKCNVDNTLTVQNDIWAEDVLANNIICHDRIVAQGIDAVTVECDGKIILGKTLAVEECARSIQNIICGETAFGAGKVVATSVMTSEPLDLDNGENAIESPFTYAPRANADEDSGSCTISNEYMHNNDYVGFLTRLLMTSEGQSKDMLKRYLFVLKAIDNAYPQDVNQFTDTSLLIWLIEIKNSNYFKSWDVVSEWTAAVRQHFDDMAHGKMPGEAEGKPATNLRPGYIISHAKFGRGRVKDVVVSGGLKTAIVLFDNFMDTKKFPLPDALKYFKVISITPAIASEKIKHSMVCNIGSYSEWLSALKIIKENESYLGKELHEIIFDLLLAKIGLKSKFIETRFKEKGWD